MLKGKEYKLIIDQNDTVKGVYVRDIPHVLAEVIGEMAAEMWKENKKNLRWFAAGMVVMAAIAWIA